nr:hypothetical protein [Xanthomonas campestris]
MTITLERAEQLLEADLKLALAASKEARARAPDCPPGGRSCGLCVQPGRGASAHFDTAASAELRKLRGSIRTTAPLDVGRDRWQEQNAARIDHPPCCRRCPLGD